MKPGLSFGGTDPIGYEAMTDKVSVHDLHARVADVFDDLQLLV